MFSEAYPWSLNRNLSWHLRANSLVLCGYKVKFRSGRGCNCLFWYAGGVFAWVLVEVLSCQVLNISFADVSPETCMLIDWGDGTLSLYHNDTAVCDAPTGLTVTDGVLPSMVVSHLYTQAQSYSVKITASDDFSSVEETFT